MKKTLDTKKRGMAYGVAIVGRNWVQNLNMHPRRGTKMNVFGAIGDSEELPVKYYASIIHYHEQPASGYPESFEDVDRLESLSPMLNSENYSGVDGQDAARKWQPGATISRCDDPEWKQTKGQGLRLYTQADRNSSALQSQLTTPYDGERSWSESKFLSEPWNPSVSQGMIAEQSTLDLHADSCDQPRPSERCTERLGKSPPGRLDKGDFCYAESSAEVSSRLSHSNLTNVPVCQRGQQYLHIPTYASIYSLATDISPVSPTKKEEQLYCRESGCRAIYKGIYANGNLARHRRLKHNSHHGRAVREYACANPGCSKTYKRQDARVKHYRKHHQHLASGPALSRKRERSM